MNNGDRAMPVQSYDDTSTMYPPASLLEEVDEWRELLMREAIPVAVTNGSTFRMAKPGAALTDTLPVDYDSLFAGTIEVRMGGLLSQVMGQNPEISNSTRMPIGVEAQRSRNRQFYDNFKQEIDTRFQGRVVVIANGAIAAVADSFEAVKDIARDADHRLVFRAGGKEWRTRGLRLPISRK